MALIRFVDGRELPVGKILCTVRNYRSHAREMGTEPPKEPVWFLKPPSALIHSGGTIELPPESRHVDVETELAAVMGEAAVAGYAVFFDITARDLQKEAKQVGLPWTRSKGFPTFAAIADVASAEDPGALHITLRVNGEVRQNAPTSDMIFDLPTLLESARRFTRLDPGDIIATGTPSGVWRIEDGDELEGSITGLPELHCTVRRALGAP
jgi:2-keto-4-pentenoate hydratase/2-oxohepta-3-ene-1,7-dioic acid hydratase in catechol pathway